MPKQLTISSVSAPAFYGLNSQRKADILPFAWATRAENCVIDDSGRIAARKGYQHINAGTILSTAPIRTIHEYIDKTGSIIQIFAADKKLWKLDGTSIPVQLTVPTTPTADNWKFQNFNGKCVGTQAGHEIIVLASVSDTAFSEPTLTGSLAPSAASDSILASFGRIWALDGVNLCYSFSLDETSWGDATPNAGGVFDLSTVWLSGMDIPVALAEFNGHLVIFGKQSIIVYANPWSPAEDMVIVENIGGIGCIARDSIQHIGNDILFLSGQGIRSLGRVVQEKSMPINDVSKNVNDDLNVLVTSETLANIKSGYSKTEGFYVLSLPTSNKCYYFDLRQQLPDGSYKVTTWQTGFSGVNVSSDGTLYVGTLGFISTYQGYKDAVLNDGNGGSNYDMVYESGWNDIDAPSSVKIPKKLAVLLLGGNGQTVVLKWAFDFSDVFNSFSKTLLDTSKAEYQNPLLEDTEGNLINVALSLTGGVVAEYGHRWSVANTIVDGEIGDPSAETTGDASEYAGGSTYNRIKIPMAKSGQLIKFGINIEISGAAVAVQQIDMHSKIGRAAI